ncbi:MAG: hypothetical protein AAF502_21255 [Bacteroidota bacterium]
MKGIKSPGVLSKMGPGDYKKRLKVALEAFQKEYGAAMGAGKQPEVKSFAIFPEFELDEGEKAQVIILGLNSKWVRYLKEVRGKKGSCASGIVTIASKALYFDIKKRIRFTDTEIERNNTKDGYKKIFKAYDLEFELGESFAKASVEVDSDVISTIAAGPLKTMVENYRVIDKDDEVELIKAIERIKEGIDEWKSANSSMSSEQEKALEKLVYSLDADYKEAEDNMVMEIYEDFETYMEERSSITSFEEIESELKEMRTLFETWKAVTKNQGIKNNKKRMETLFGKVKTELATYKSVKEKANKLKDLIEEYDNLTDETSSESALIVSQIKVLRKELDMNL